MLAFLPRQGIFSKTKFLAELLYKKHSLYLPGGLTMFFPHLPMASVQHSDKGGSAISLFVFILVPGKPVPTIKMYSLFKKGLARKCSLFPCLPAGASQKRNPCRNNCTKTHTPFGGLTAFFPCLPAASLQHANKGGSAISLFVFTLVPGKPVPTIKTKRRKLSFTPLSSVAEREALESVLSQNIT